MKNRGFQSIMYLAHPTRIWKAGGSDRIMDFARKKGFAPVNPFTCGDFRDFEGGVVGREGTLWWTLYLQRGCPWSGYFGISDGVMRELRDRLRWDEEKRIRVFYDDDNGVPFDPKWEEEYAVLSKEYGDLLAKLRGPNTLYAFVGPRAVGKTYWIDRLLGENSTLERVKNTTTRPARNADDLASYNFISAEQFTDKVGAHDFLEYVHYENHLYGSSLSEIRKVLERSNGIFAVTPDGAQALYRCRFELNIKFILFKASPAVLLTNLKDRGIHDPQEQERLIKKANLFTLPATIPHQIIELGRNRSDKQKMLDIFE